MTVGLCVFMCVFRVSLEYIPSQPMYQNFLGIVNKIVCFSLQCLRCRLLTWFTYRSQLTTFSSFFPTTVALLTPVADREKNRVLFNGEKQIIFLFFVCDILPNEGIKSQREDKKA